MSKIRILPDSIANKIAAGEVVERPASVVKELVENSLDAGAKKITVTLKVGGKNLIKIVDDGCGMSADDALTALERHATSKITSEKDLEGIVSLGFRGEALPSIASVSRMQIITRTKDDAAGVSIKLEGGKIRNVKEIGAPVGTSVEIANLFFNVPARRKFLKTTATELSHITRILSQVALARPELRLQVEHNDRRIIHAPSASDLPERIAQIMGAHVRSEMIPVDFSHDSYSIKGLVLKPSYARAGKSAQNIFVNRRPVRDSMVARAAYDAYSAQLAHNRHPGWILFIEMDPQEVDVNVHPAKSEVRFANQKRIYNLVREGILAALENADLSVESKHFTQTGTSHKPAAVSFRRETPAVSKKESETIRLMVADYVRTQKKPDSETIPSPSTPSPVSPQTFSESPTPQNKVEASESKDSKRDSIAEWVPIGQFHNSYLVCQSSGELILVDQHAAHERILFEKFFHDLENRSIATQRLLFPIPVELSPSETLIMEDYGDCFVELGFTMDHFGQNTFMLKEVPALLGQEDIGLLVKDILTELTQTGRALAMVEVKEKIAAFAACRGAVKANQKLKTEEITSLLHQMEQLNNPYCCPHGRPCVVKYSLSTLKKDFHRT